MAKPSLYPETFYPEKNCLMCHRTYGLHLHHIYPGTGRRGVSDREGCTVYLCAEHHEFSDYAVHTDVGLCRELQRDCQRRWEMREGKGHEDFIRVFGESYL